MGNMGYCRFRNTERDLEECIDALKEREELSKDEINAGERMLEMVLEFCKYEGIIEGYDSDIINSVFGECKEEDEEEEE